MKNRNLPMAACAAVTVATLLTACSTPRVGDDFSAAGNAIRAAEVAGAATYAPQEFAAAVENHQKAEKLLLDGRLERAEKLLQLSSAQADLATAISEAEYAEESLQNLLTASAQ